MPSSNLSFLKHENIVSDYYIKEDVQLFIYSFVIMHLDYRKYPTESLHLFL